MLRFAGAWYHNFRSHAETELPFEQNDSMFVGGIHEHAPALGSNATGKSLLIDGVYWCLYDQTVRGFGKDQVIGRADTWASVGTRWIDDDGRVIDILRYRRHPEFKNEVLVIIDGVEESRTTVTKTNRYIQQLFGMDDVAFLHTAILSKSRRSICDERETERRKLLWHILRFERIDEGFKAAQKHKRELEKALQRIELKLTQERTTEREIENTIASVEATIAQMQESQAQARQAYQLRLQEIERQLDNLNNAHTVTVEEQFERRQRLEQQQPLQDQIQQLRNEMGQLNASEIKSMSTYTVWQQKVVAGRQTISDMLARIGTDCPTCLQPVNPMHARRVAHVVRRDVKHAERLKTEAAKRVKASRTRKANLTQQIEDLECQLEPGLRATIEAADRQIETIVNQIATLQNLAPEPPTNDVDVFEDELVQQQERLQQTQTKVAEFVRVQTKTQRQVAMASYWVHGFGPKGLKAYVLGDVLDHLQVRANDLLAEFSDGYMSVRWETDVETESGAAPERLALIVSRQDQDDCEYHFCSEGEKARVWIAMERALSEISMGNVDVRFVDECFDGLSKEGIDRAIRLVAGEARERRLLCISHFDHVRRHFNFHATVRMAGGVSTFTRDDDE